jgi:hypothetical protein
LSPQDHFQSLYFIVFQPLIADEELSTLSANRQCDLIQEAIHQLLAKRVATSVRIGISGDGWVMEATTWGYLRVICFESTNYALIAKVL